MITPPDRLNKLLENQALKPGYLVFGDEPLQVMESLDQIRSAIRAAGANERIVLEVDRGFDWDSVRATMSGMSLFAEQRIIEVRLAERKPDKSGTALLSELLSAPAGEDVLLLSAGKLDRNQQKAKWFKAFEKFGMVVQARQLSGQHLERWITHRAHNIDLTIDREVADLIATRAEGNMLAAAQEIDKLALLSDNQRVDIDTALKAIADSARYDVFKLVDCVLAGNVAHAMRMLRGLKEEGIEPLIINWALNRELRQLSAIAIDVAAGKGARQAINDAGVWQSRAGMIEGTLRRHAPRIMQDLFLRSTRIDRMIKGSLLGNPWDEMELLCLNLVGSGHS